MNYKHGLKNRIKKCLICNKQFRAKKDCITRNQIYCSRQCSWIGRKGTIPNHNQLEGLKKGRYKGKKIGGWSWSKESRERVKGNKSHRWEGGKTKLNFKIRNSWRMRQWRKKILKRDNYTCVICKKRGIRLIADHIKPFALYPKLRFIVKNGRTICKECDLKSDTYAGRAIKNRICRD